tara:strand:+ start:124 stop:324 length:201 start_codon:yes stop_codon:yes gene_type:complete
MKKLIAIMKKLSLPLAINYIKENEDLLAKKFADSKDIPMLNEKREKELASAFISIFVEFLEDINKK